MIRTCFFDMGNVLVFFSHARMCAQIGQLSGHSGEQVREWLIESGIQWDFERGRLDPVKFHDAWQVLASSVVCPNEMSTAASDIFVLNEPMVPLLDELRQTGLRLVLLSNTSQWHFEFIRRQWQVLDRFDDFALSYQLDAIKPEPAIFEGAQQLAGCTPDECFYTDDIADYVAAGKQRGWHARLFTGAEQCRADLVALGALRG